MSCRCPTRTGPSLCKMRRPPEAQNTTFDISFIIPYDMSMSMVMAKQKQGDRSVSRFTLSRLSSACCIANWHMDRAVHVQIESRRSPWR